MERPIVGIMAQDNCIVPAIYGGEMGKTVDHGDYGEKMMASLYRKGIR